MYLCKVQYATTSPDNRISITATSSQELSHQLGTLIWIYSSLFQVEGCLRRIQGNEDAFELSGHLVFSRKNS